MPCFLQVDSSDLSSSIDLALEYVVNQTATVSSDPYTLAIVAYALAKVKNHNVYGVLRELDALAKVEGK